MEEEEYNDIVTYIQDQKYPQNAETSNVWFTSITTVY
jgi:predicted transcriptional regulator